MALRILPSFRSLLLSIAALALAGCNASPPPFAQLSGLILAPRLDEISGMAASRAHDDTLWVANDGGNAADLHAIGLRGGLQATFHVAGVANTDWEDLAAFDLEGRHYLLIADTGDNGGLRKTLQLHVIEEPGALADGTVRPAWSIAFRWPDGPRDCEAVAVDAERGEILLVSKRRQPPELWSLPLRPRDRSLLVARRLGHLAGVPQPDAEALREDARAARIRNQVTAADLSPDGRTLAVLTYHDVLLYRRHGRASWAATLGELPEIHALPWLPQAEALAWSRSGRALYATGEHSPAPLLYLNPRLRVDRTR
jgi:hypothetical protein